MQRSEATQDAMAILGYSGAGTVIGSVIGSSVFNRDWLEGAMVGGGTSLFLIAIAYVSHYARRR